MMKQARVEKIEREEDHETIERGQSRDGEAAVRTAPRQAPARLIGRRIHRAVSPLGR
jgi:hypothetical protein